MSKTLIEVADAYIGKRETDGPNDGPEIRRWKLEMSRYISECAGIPWCGIFVAAMLMERNHLSRTKLIEALGFDPRVAFLESCDSWLLNSMKAKLLVDAPVPGDLFLVMAPLKRTPSGTIYSNSDALHIGICTSRLEEGNLVQTIEGNTTPGTVEGKRSHNGDGVYRRTRLFQPGRLKFIRLPARLTGLGG